MRFTRKCLPVILASILLMTGCGSNGTNTSSVSSEDVSTDASVSSESSISEVSEMESSLISSEAEDTGVEVFERSKGINEDGYWEGVVALDYVKVPVYKGLSIPSDIHTMSDEEVQGEIDKILESAAGENQVMDRAAEMGDTVNIDYIGRVDGEAFEGGSTDGNGMSVVVGSRDFIDDFLDQIEGHMPGETFDIEVTFPEDYQTQTLQGKDAVFETTLNYISEPVLPEYNDAFVVENLSERYGWKTVEESREGIRNSIQDQRKREHLVNSIIAENTVESIPASVMEYQNASLIDDYRNTAAGYGMELEDYLSAATNAATIEEFLEMAADEIEKTASFTIIVQAIAEDANIAVMQEDINEYLGDTLKDAEAQYGLPYIKQVVLTEKVIKMVTESAVLEETT